MSAIEVFVNVYSFFYKGPPILANYTDLVLITNTQHDRFMVQLRHSHLDNGNGPITAWGVLVTSDPSGTLSFLYYTT